ncbi:MAG: LysR family transcriptional regulator [Candidatus Binatia bacterium]
MEIKALRTFIAVTETGSFTRAGQRLSVSQSAVSQQIRILEKEVGTPLFTRRARNVTPTQAGNVLLPYARQITAKADEAAAVISDFEGMGRGRVAIGAGGAICHHVLPSILSEFSARFSKIEIQVLSGFTVETLDRTLDGTVDVGLLVLPITTGGLMTTELGRDELVAIAPRGHRWESLERVRARDFSDEQVVVYNRSSRTFRILERFLLEDGVFPKFAMEISDLEAVKKMVEVGLGVSVVAAWAVRREIDDGTLISRPLAPRGLYRTWGLVRRSGETATASHRAFINICKTRFASLLSSER